MKTLQLYTQPSCPPCQFVKLYLEDNQVPYQQHDVKNDARARNHMISVLHSSATPTIEYGDIVIRGVDMDKLEQVISLIQLSNK
ncbi:hypothetical protein Q73_04625 [Bacillus coahuilensis m2-6]|uniref:glutaredoxin domain-containing protein n=1 Tax=Bacillus coahuilensis TaxID=408580 RepID=UPI0001850CCF|nr:glutaredoxin domain-containing protein [Bacillus coahuilensis]KUP08768.1 hypothetical protein Q73_04625 [Bacillus coahuilensis m2-6]